MAPSTMFRNTQLMSTAYADAVAFGCSYATQEAEVQKQMSLLSIQETAASGSERMEPCSCEESDFIIFSEFSEVKGPMTIFTIPLNIEAVAGMDINAFIMKIMSVDYQANPSGQFTICEDAQVLQTDIIRGIHAYIHYFTLNDVFARGFVRPLCVSYISKDKYKIERLFPVLREQFSKATRMMKYSNRLLFCDEVSQVLAAIKEAQCKYFSFIKKEECRDTSFEKEKRPSENVDINQLVHQFGEYNNMYHTTEQFLVDEFCEEVTNIWRNAFHLHEEMEAISCVAEAKSTKEDLIALVCTNFSSSKREPESLRPILTLCSWGIVSSLWKLCKIQKRHNICRLKIRLGNFPFGKYENNMPSSVYDVAPMVDLDKKLESSEELEVVEGTSCRTYLQLLKCIDHVSFEEDGQSDEHTLVGSRSEYVDSYFTATDIEGDDYYSATENISELSIDKRSLLTLTNIQHDSITNHSSASSESFLEIHSSTDDSSSIDSNEDFGSLELSSWESCVWRWCPRMNNWMGYRLHKFLKSFPNIAHHIIYSLLIGRTVVLCGPDSRKRKVSKIISCLIPVVPNHLQEPVKFLRWHKGILISTHIETYKVIGLCVPERLSVHDMLSTQDKNNVTILDVNSKQLFGPAYAGTVLAPLEKGCHEFFIVRESMLIFLQSILMELEEKVFLFIECERVWEDPSSKIMGESEILKHQTELLRDLGVQGCDIEIIKYLRKFVSSVS